MFALLVKSFPSILHSSHSLPPHHHQTLLTPLLRFTFSSQSQSKSQKMEDIPFVAQYLTSSFGLSLDRALKVSAYPHLAAIKSSDRPDSVLRFLKDTGMSDSQIKAAILFHPKLLSYNVDKTLKPRVKEIMAARFSGEILVQLIQYNPEALAMKNPVLPLQFWREFVGNDDEALLKVIQRNRLLFTCNIDGYVVPRLNLFREYGLSRQQIATLLTRRGLVLQSLDRLKWAIEKTLKLGLRPGSGMFLLGLEVLAYYNENTFNQKIAFFKKSFGWSEEDVYSAFRNYPKTIACSEERLKSHMDFLTIKAMLDTRSIASQPRLLGSSLERTLVPRHHVLTILKAHALKKDYKLLSACKLSEERFLEKCVVPHEKDVPGLGEAYATACSGKVPP